jgi:predicted esterase
MRTFALTLGLVLCLCPAQAQEVVQVTWPTAHAAPPATFPQGSSDFLPAFRLSLYWLSESNVVDMAASQAAILGVSTKDADRLRRLFAGRYGLIQKDPVFRDVGSVLPYCYSAQTPTQGLALVYSPKKLDANTPALVFLHGYGGSFLWSQQLLAEAFPNHLIICPAYGISSASMSSTYLSECLQAVQKKVRQPIRPPVLMGLSAGGFGAARIFTQSPTQFSRLIVLAAYPPEETLTHFNKKMSARFLVGTKEDYVQSGLFGRYMQSIRPRLKDLEFQAIPDADHFFLLGKKEEAIKVLRSWMETSSATAPAIKK